MAEDAVLRRWKVEGMDCPSCVAKIEGALVRLPGVREVAVNLMAETLSVIGTADGAVLEQALRNLGYAARPLATPAHDHAAGHSHAHGDDDAAEAGLPWWRTGKARLVWLLAGLVCLAYVVSVAAPGYGPRVFEAATLMALWPFGRRAVALARAGSPFSIETLMCAAAVGAVSIGAGEEAAIVVLLFALGELLENVAAGRARAGIRALAALIPRTARVERAGAFAEVPAEALAVGEVVQVRPGDRVPCDGTILDGRSSLDESPVTGESVPVLRGPGEAVVAGAINTDAVLRVEVTRAAADNTISRIVRMVEEATASRAPTQRFIERFSQFWTPGAMAVSALVILLPPLLLGGDWPTWIYRGLAVLLIACPCALVISVPAAVASGLSAGARRGLLVKGGAALELLAKTRTVAFDKTGTLTRGRPAVTDILAVDGDEAALLRLAASVEAGSSHPLAKAVTAAAAERGLDVPAAADAAAIPGRAATALVAGRRISVGSPSHAAAEGADLSAFAGRIETLEQAGKTVVVVTEPGRPLGLLALRDEPRDDAATALDALRGLGVEAVMLTGDNLRTGAAIGQALGIAARAGLLPADKLAAIEELKRQGPVAMVGDGINDAPALAAASVGIAMGGGTDVALETADAALLKERVGGVAELVALARDTLANVHQNVAISVGLKLVFLATTLVGATGLWMAILADTGATVLVTLNALRLLGWKGGAR